VNKDLQLTLDQATERAESEQNKTNSALSSLQLQNEGVCDLAMYLSFIGIKLMAHYFLQFVSLFLDEDGAGFLMSSCYSDKHYLNQRSGQRC